MQTITATPVWGYDRFDSRILHAQLPSGERYPIRYRIDSHHTCADLQALAIHTLIANIGEIAQYALRFELDADAGCAYPIWEWRDEQALAAWLSERLPWPEEAMESQSEIESLANAIATQLDPGWRDANESNSE